MYCRGVFTVQVCLDSGVLLGRHRTTQNGRRYSLLYSVSLQQCSAKQSNTLLYRFSSFTRIPYARPPVGPLRFCRPEPAPPWQATLDASKPCPKPVQNNYVTGLLEGQV